MEILHPSAIRARQELEGPQLSNKRPVLSQSPALPWRDFALATHRQGDSQPCPGTGWGFCAFWPGLKTAAGRPSLPRGNPCRHVENVTKLLLGIAASSCILFGQAVCRDLKLTSAPSHKHAPPMAATESQANISS